MDIFGLPDVFIRKLMRTMTIKDRLALRLTCRAFEELVANTHAGCFERGFIRSYFNHIRRKQYLGINIGGQRFKMIEMAEYGSVLNLRQRLFSGISVGVFALQLGSMKEFPVDFILKLTKNFTIRMLSTSAKTRDQLDSARDIMKAFPATKYVLDLAFMPSLYHLLSLPPMDTLRMQDELPAEIFANLLATHSHLRIANTAIGTDKWKALMQKISNTESARSVRFVEFRAEISAWLRGIGVTEATTAGTVCGEFEVTLNERRGENFQDIGLKLGKCWMTIHQFGWTDVAIDEQRTIYFPATITFGNGNQSNLKELDDFTI